MAAVWGALCNKVLSLGARESAEAEQRQRRAQNSKQALGIRAALEPLQRSGPSGAVKRHNPYFFIEKRSERGTG